MALPKEKTFDKYKKRGNLNWTSLMSHDVRFFNSFQQARYDWILNIAGDIKGKKIIDVGCGGGSLTYLMAKRGAIVTGVESDEDGVSYAKENLKSVNHNNKLKYEIIHSSAYDMATESESFDIAVSCEVIEHLQEPERMLSEVQRVLKKGGEFIITTPYRFTEFPRDKNHVKEYFPTELEKIFGKYFRNIHIKLTHHMFWRFLYSYPIRSLGNRQIGKWLINTSTLFIKWNPFMIDYKKHSKADAFSTICMWGYK